MIILILFLVSAVSFIFGILIGSDSRISEEDIRNIKLTGWNECVDWLCIADETEEYREYIRIEKERRFDDGRNKRQELQEKQA